MDGVLKAAILTILTYIMNISGGVLSVSEFSNLAVGKPARQSTTWPNYIASLAVDGNKNNDFDDGSCSSTYEGNVHWWEVDLEMSAVVYEIAITNRNTLGFRLADFNILVGKSADSMEICEYFKGPGEDKKEYRIPCRHPKTGRYVRIQKLTDTTPLTLCEVEIFGIRGLNFKREPDVAGSADSSVRVHVQTRLSCAAICVQDINCVGFNLSNTGRTEVTCELLQNNITSTGFTKASVLLYR